MKKLSVLTGILIFLLGVTNAHAASKCRGANVRVKNLLGKPIKVTKFEYYDYKKKKYRREGTRNKKIRKGKTARFTKNLEGVGGQKLESFKVYYKLKKNKRSYGKVRVKKVNNKRGKKLCKIKGGSKYLLVLKK